MHHQCVLLYIRCHSDDINLGMSPIKMAASILIYKLYILESACSLFVRSKRQNYGTDRRQTLRNYEERSGECPPGLKSPALVFSGRNSDISGLSFADNRHFYLPSFHFRLLPRRLTQHYRKYGIDCAPHHYR